ncbi:HD domain-containing phosphohydrolase [Massilia sp. TS11]|uniref:HD domain-containing phosphohydrolase n=1 Tax=Massilia sp. TS11 TaxID=2908003 RepID=UPI001EDA09E0|nr:HD domain-containing phosphohydrolase [Massilia sp. TS11]MCG2586080.1 response regulator [Massilia sp. TS11]
MTILLVDDTDLNLKVYAALMENTAPEPCVSHTDPVAALYWCETHTPDLVIVDYHMPNLDGISFVRLLRALPACASVPVVMVTTDTERSVRSAALAAGATDFLTKPLDASEFRSRVRNLLDLRRAQNLLADRARLLQHEVEQATAQIRARERELVLRLARAAEWRDPETGSHIQRMAAYAGLIAARMGLPASFQDMLMEAAPMHDIGKLATPDQVLLKPGRLDPDELDVMRQHAAAGADILAGSDAPLLQMAAEIAASHHEHFDGSGYPYGLRGEAIPLAARIVAVADVFDALTSVRPYKRAWGLDEARAHIVARRGSQFCPACCDAFLSDWDAVLAIRARYQD